MGLFDRKNKDEQQDMEQNSWVGTADGNNFVNLGDSFTKKHMPTARKFDNIQMVGLGEDLR